MKEARERKKNERALVQQVSEYQLVAGICRDSFFEFVKEFWDDEKWGAPVWNWHIEYLCRQMQQVAMQVYQGKPKLHDLLINIPPGTTKSTIVSIMFVPWTWTFMPNARHIDASHTERLVEDMGLKARDIIYSEKYQACYPDVRLREDQSTKGFFVNTKGGGRLSVTVAGKSPTGFHAHFIKIDDPVDPKKALSEAELKIANDFMTETIPTRKVDKAVTVTIMIMQRLHQNDPSGNWLERVRKSQGRLKLKHICLPAEITEDIRPKALRRQYKDGLLDPVRLSGDVLEEYKMQGTYSYAGQFLQSPVPLGGGMFDTTKLVFGTPPGPRHFKRVVRAWDNAASAGGGDYTSGTKMGITQDDQIWILHQVRGQWATNQRENVKDQYASMDGKQVEIVQEQEPGSGGKDTAATTSVRLGTRGYRVITVHPTGDKVLRADPLSVQVNAGNVYLAYGNWNQEYVDEMKFFPYSTYDDQIDSSSLAYNEITKPVRVIGGLWDPYEDEDDELMFMGSGEGDVLEI